MTQHHITLSGCDDENEFDMDLTDLEWAFMQRLSAAANEASTYGCEPRMYLDNKRDDDPWGDSE
jgi:hypothetical protein